MRNEKIDLVTDEIAAQEFTMAGEDWEVFDQLSYIDNKHNKVNAGITFTGNHLSLTMVLNEFELKDRCFSFILLPYLLT